MWRNWQSGHHVSPDRPENGRNADVFGHNQKRSLTHADVGRHFNSGSDRNRWGDLFRSGVDQSAGRTNGGLKRLSGRFSAVVLGDTGNAFGGSNSQADQLAGRRGRISDRISGLGRRDLPKSAYANHRPITTRILQPAPSAAEVGLCSPIAFSSEVDTGSREENASKQ